MISKRLHPTPQTWLAAGSWLILVLVALYTRTLWPIDETRYASVAWEMWLRGDFLVPYLNGAPYSHKPPLMFWLFQAGWWAFGVTDWWPRLVPSLFALANLWLSTRLARLLWPRHEAVARYVPLILLGCLLWTFFTTVTLFDMLLTGFTLLGLLGVLHVWHRGGTRGWLLLGVAIGLGMANFVKPGSRLPEDKRIELREKYADQSEKAVKQAANAKSLRDSLLDIIPRNPLQEMVGALDGSSPGGGMLAVMFFALVCGVAISISPERTAPLVAVLEGLYDISMVVIGWAMRIAPIGVFGLMFSLTATLGTDILQTLIWYVGAVLAALALHMFGVYSLVVWLFAKLSPRQFFGRISEVLLTAFATSSSNATLPTSLRVAEEKLGVKREVANFAPVSGRSARSPIRQRRAAWPPSPSRSHAKSVRPGSP